MALSEMVLQLPPLRKREGDIGLLAAHFIREYADQRQVSGISPAGRLGLVGVAALEGQC